MPPLTSIADQKTPARPIETTFDANTGLPSANQEVLLVGHMAASGSATPYSVVVINNVADVVAASGEVAPLFGDGSELARMVLAAIKANAGGSTFPSLKCVPLMAADTDFGASDAALAAIDKVKAEFIVSPYDGVNTVLTGKIRVQAKTMSGAGRTDNNQFGTMAVVANQNTANPGNLPIYDDLYLAPAYLRDTTGAAPQLIAEFAATHAAFLAANAVPFNPVDKLTVGFLQGSSKQADALTIGGGLESETVLNKGWSPYYVKPNGDVAILRSVTSRLTTGDGVTSVGDTYIDVQDFQVAYYWKKTIWTRYNQPDFTNVKASPGVAKQLKSEVIRLAYTFQDQTMFQSVDQLAKQFQVERALTDRSRFDVLTPINITPALHVIATNEKLTTQFDVTTV